MKIRHCVKAFIINSKGELLIGKRKEGDTGAGLWDLPGGGVEAGESAKVALAREVAEEVNFTKEVEVLNWLFEIVISHYKNPKERLWFAFYLVKLGHYNVVPAEEFAELRWISAADTKNYKFFNSIRAAITLFTLDALAATEDKDE